MKRALFLLIIFLIVFTAACNLIQRGPSTEELEATAAAETLAATQLTPAPTNTPAPSDTPAPTATPLPTNTPLPTSTPTDTPPPIDTPTASPTPGPITFKDDFSSKSGAWSECKECVWEDGVLYMGPYPAKDSVEAYFAYCDDCGTPTYYRMSVDAKYIEGPTDRGYGLLIRQTDEYIYDFEITTWQVAGGWIYDLDTHMWDALSGWKFTGLLKPGRAENHIEVVVQPDQSGQADIFLKINGKTFFVAFGRKAEPGRVGLAVGFHSIGVIFDNFEFEEIWPE